MYQYRLEWALALDYYKQAVDVARDSTPFYWYASALESAGYLTEPTEYYATAERLDPVYPQLQFGLGVNALHRNDVEAARQHMQRAIDGGNANGWVGMTYVFLMKNDVDGLRTALEAILQQYTLGRFADSDSHREAISDILAALDDPDERARGVAGASNESLYALLKWFDADEEMLAHLRNQLVTGNTTLLTNNFGASVWMPALKEARQLPQFKPLLRDSGLVDLWRERGWPDLCRPVGDTDFYCD